MQGGSVGVGVTVLPAQGQGAGLGDGTVFARSQGEGGPLLARGQVFGGEGNTCASLRTSQGGEKGMGMGAGVEGVPVQLQGCPAARPALRPADEWEQVGAEGPGRAGCRLGAAAGQQRHQQQPEQEEECWVFFPLSLSLVFVGFWYFFSPLGLLFLAALTKRAGPPQAGLFKGCFSSAAKLGEDEGQCLPCA